MSQKFVPLEDAAKQLSLSKERLNELREAGDVRAYRDGTSWKFRSEDLATLATKLTDEGEGPGSDPALGAGDEPSDPSDSIMVSDVDVGGSASRKSSTIIGDQRGEKPGDSDLELALDDTGAGPVSDAQTSGAGSDILAAASGSNVLGPSETPPVPGGKFEDLDEIEIDLETESSKILSGIDLETASDDDDAELSDLQLVDSDIGTGSSPTGGSEIQLADDEDDDLVLSESGGSDITLGAGDSGINLVQPSDSGLALDELDLDLGGSSVSSLELEEASREQLELEEEPAGEAAEAGEADDFLLTPLTESQDDEDSSSQVIALDSESDLEESAASLLGEHPEETAVLEPVEDDEGPAVVTAPLAEAGSDLVLTQPVEFSGANVAFLALSLIILAVCGVMMIDLLRNMWSWSEPFSVNTTLVESLNFFD